MKEALKLALEALEWINRVNAMDYEYQQKAREALNAIYEALAQPEQEPVAFGMLRADGLILDVICPDEHESFAGEYTIPLYTTPPKRPWVGLTDEEIWKFWWSRPEVLDGEDDGMEAEFVAAVRRPRHRSQAMTERDKELALQSWTENDWEGYLNIKKLMALVRADERRECEMAVEELMPDASRGECAAAIRARGNT